MQNLNLYQVEKARVSGPQRGHLLLGLVLLALACLLHGGWQGWRLQEGGERLAQAESQAQAQESLLAKAKASFVEPRLDPELPLRLASKEAQNRELQRVLTYLDLLARQQRIGFVAPLAALAEQHPPSGLWLNGITLREGGSEMRLQGLSQHQELLPQYLQRLGQSAVFKGREFARFDVQRGADELLHFDLSSRAQDQEERP